MQLYQIFTICAKPDKSGYENGYVMSVFTADPTNVARVLNAPKNEYRECQVYEYPSMKRITKADIVITKE